MNGKAVIQRERNYLVLFGPDNKRIAHEEIPVSGKTLQIEVKLQLLAKRLGFKVR
jgi:hypothetical protein